MMQSMTQLHKMITVMKRGGYKPQYTRDYTEEAGMTILFRPLQMRVGVLIKSFMLETMQWLYELKIWYTMNGEMPMFRHLRMKEGVTLELLTHIVV